MDNNGKDNEYTVTEVPYEQTEEEQTQVSETEVTEEVEEVAKPIDEAPVESTPVAEEPKKKGCALPIIIVVVVLLILICGGIIAFIIMNNNKGDKPGTNTTETTTTTTEAQQDNSMYVEKMLSNRIISIDKVALQSKKLKKPSAFEYTEFTLNGTSHKIYQTYMTISSVDSTEKTNYEANLDGLYLIAKSNGKVDQMFTIKDNNGKEYEVLVISEDNQLTRLTIIDGDNNAIFRTLESNCSITEEAYDGKFIKVEDDTVYVKIHRGFDAGGMTSHSLEIKIKVVDGEVKLEAGELTDWLGSKNCPR